MFVYLPDFLTYYFDFSPISISNNLLNPSIFPIKFLYSLFLTPEWNLGLFRGKYVWDGLTYLTFFNNALNSTI